MKQRLLEAKRRKTEEQEKKDSLSASYSEIEADYGDDDEDSPKEGNVVLKERGMKGVMRVMMMIDTASTGMIGMMTMSPETTNGNDPKGEARDMRKAKEREVENTKVQKEKKVEREKPAVVPTAEGSH